jgi:thymidylate kinase
MHLLRKIRQTNLASFSGIDGAGKSTQIEALCRLLKKDGRQVRVIRFWDDIARLTQIREATGHTLFKGDKGIGTPSLPINRRDKNVKSFLMTGVRLLLYFIDAISLRAAVQKALRTDADLVIFDRYIYDELANLTLSNPVIRTYIRLIMMLVPKPDISYLLDADPMEARARKPEYPLEFLYTNRLSYLDLSVLVRGMTVIDPMPTERVTLAVLKYALEELSLSAVDQNHDGGLASGDNCGKLAKLDGSQSRQSTSTS